MKLYKYIALALVVCMLAQDVGFAAQAGPRATSHEPRKKTHGAELGQRRELGWFPKSLGLVEETYAGTNGKTILLIQDAHDSLEAQENIARLVTHFTKQGVRTVFEEGYAGAVPTDEYFGFIRDKHIKEKVSFYYLDRLQIGGAEYAHINRRSRLTDHEPRIANHEPRPPAGQAGTTHHEPRASGLRPQVVQTAWTLIGADDLPAYLENVRVFADADRTRQEIDANLFAIFNEIAEIGRQKLPKQTQNWIRDYLHFENGRLPFEDYLARTLPLFTKQELATLPFLQAAQELAVSGQAGNGEQETETPGDDIGQHRELARAKTSGTPEGRGQSSPAGTDPFGSYRHESRAANRAAAQAFLQSIDPQEVLREMATAQLAAEKKLFQTSEEIQLWHFLRALHRLDQLAKLKLNPTDLETLKTEINQLDTEKLAYWIARAKKGPVVLSKKWESQIKSALRFYELAQIREHAIEKTLLDWRQETEDQRLAPAARTGSVPSVARGLPPTVSKSQTPTQGTAMVFSNHESQSANHDTSTAVLVFGGFHKEGITKILRDNGFSYVVITPKISELSPKHQKLYHDAMLRGTGSVLVAKQRGLTPLVSANGTRSPAMFLKPSARVTPRIISLARLASEHPDWDSALFSARADDELGRRPVAGDPSGTEGADPFGSQLSASHAGAVDARSEMRNSKVLMLPDPKFSLTEKKFFRERARLFVKAYEHLDPSLRRLLVHPSFLLFFMGAKPSYIVFKRKPIGVFLIETIENMINKIIMRFYSFTKSERLVYLTVDWVGSRYARDNDPDHTPLFAALSRNPEFDELLKQFEWGKRWAYEIKPLAQALIKSREFLFRHKVLLQDEMEKLNEAARGSSEPDAKFLNKLKERVYYEDWSGKKQQLVFNGIALGYPERDVDGFYRQINGEESGRMDHLFSPFIDYRHYAVTHKLGKFSPATLLYFSRGLEVLVYAYSLINRREDFAPLVPWLTQQPPEVLGLRPKNTFIGRSETRGEALRPTAGNPRGNEKAAIPSRLESPAPGLERRSESRIDETKLFLNDKQTINVEYLRELFGNKWSDKRYESFGRELFEESGCVGKANLGRERLFVLDEKTTTPDKTMFVDKTAGRDQTSDAQNEPFWRIKMLVNEAAILNLVQLTASGASGISRLQRIGVLADGQSLWIEIETMNKAKDLASTIFPTVSSVFLALIKTGQKAKSALHDNGILHRDLKPANIVRNDEDAVEVIDFETAALISDLPDKRVGRGTLGFQPLVQNYENDFSEDEEGDVYSLIMSLISLLQKNVLTRDDAYQRRLNETVSKYLRLLFENPIDPAKHNIVEWIIRRQSRNERGLKRDPPGMMPRNPEERPQTMDELIAMLQKDEAAWRQFEAEQTAVAEHKYEPPPRRAMSALVEMPAPKPAKTEKDFGALTRSNDLLAFLFIAYLHVFIAAIFLPKERVYFLGMPWINFLFAPLLVSTVGVVILEKILQKAHAIARQGFLHLWLLAVPIVGLVLEFKIQARSPWGAGRGNDSGELIAIVAAGAVGLGLHWLRLIRRADAPQRSEARTAARQKGGATTSRPRNARPTKRFIRHLPRGSRIAQIQPLPNDIQLVIVHAADKVGRRHGLDISLAAKKEIFKIAQSRVARHIYEYQVGNRTYLPAGIKRRIIHQSVKDAEEIRFYKLPEILGRRFVFVGGASKDCFRRAVDMLVSQISDFENQKFEIHMPLSAIYEYDSEVILHQPPGWTRAICFQGTISLIAEGMRKKFLALLKKKAFPQAQIRIDGQRSYLPTKKRLGNFTIFLWSSTDEMLAYLKKTSRSEMRTKEMSLAAGDPRGTVLESNVSATDLAGTDPLQSPITNGAAGARSESRKPAPVAGGDEFDAVAKAVDDERDEILLRLLPHIDPDRDPVLLPKPDGATRADLLARFRHCRTLFGTLYVYRRPDINAEKAAGGDPVTTDEWLKRLENRDTAHLAERTFADLQEARRRNSVIDEAGVTMGQIRQMMSELGFTEGQLRSEMRKTAMSPEAEGQGANEKVARLESPAFGLRMRSELRKGVNWGKVVVAVERRTGWLMELIRWLYWTLPFRHEAMQFKESDPDFQTWYKEAAKEYETRRGRIRNDAEMRWEAKSKAYGRLADKTAEEIYWKFRETYPLAPNISLLAVGSYGRNELSPGSDLDGKVIGQKKDLEAMAPALKFLFYSAQGILGSPWVQKAVEEIVSEGDLASELLTELLDARFVAGSRGVFREQKRSLAERRKNKGTVIEDVRKIIDRWQRSRKTKDFFEGLFEREPNIKTSAGGLINMNYSCWIMKVVYGGIAEARKRGQLSEEEWLAAQEAQKFLLEVRSHLHELQIESGIAPKDFLKIGWQLEVARRMGYAADALSAPRLAEFIQRYREETTTLYLFNNKVFRRALHKTKALKYDVLPEATNLKNVIAAARSGDTISLSGGFEKIENQKALTLAFKNNAKINPEEIPEIFEHAARTGTRVTGELMDAIEAARPQFQQAMKDEKFKTHARECMREILTAGTNVGYILFRMHALGILPEIWPEYKTLSNRFVADIKHRHTLDAYSIRNIEYLDELLAKPRQTEGPLSDVLRAAAEPGMLRPLRAALLTQALEDIDPAAAQKMIADFEFDPKNGAESAEGKKVEWLAVHKDALLTLMEMRGHAFSEDFAVFKRDVLKDNFEDWQLLLLMTYIRIYFFKFGRQEVYLEDIKHLLHVKKEDFDDPARLGNIIDSARARETSFPPESASKEVHVIAKKLTKKPEENEEQGRLPQAEPTTNGKQIRFDIAISEAWNRPGLLEIFSALFTSMNISVQVLQIGHTKEGRLFDGFVTTDSGLFESMEDADIAKMAGEMEAKITEVLDQISKIEPTLGRGFAYHEAYDRIVDNLFSRKALRSEKFKALMTDDSFQKTKLLFVTGAQNKSIFLKVKTPDRDGVLMSVCRVLRRHGVGIMPRTTVYTIGYAATIGILATDTFELQKDGKLLTSAESEALQNDLEFVLDQETITTETFRDMPSCWRWKIASKSLTPEQKMAAQNGERIISTESGYVLKAEPADFWTHTPSGLAELETAFAPLFEKDPYFKDPSNESKGEQKERLFQLIVKRAKEAQFGQPITVAEWGAGAAAALTEIAKKIAADPKLASLRAKIHFTAFGDMSFDDWRAAQLAGVKIIFDPAEKYKEHFPENSVDILISRGGMTPVGGGTAVPGDIYLTQQILPSLRTGGVLIANLRDSFMGFEKPAEPLFPGYEVFKQATSPVLPSDTRGWLIRVSNPSARSDMRKKDLSPAAGGRRGPEGSVLELQTRETVPFGSQLPASSRLRPPASGLEKRSEMRVFNTVDSLRDALKKRGVQIYISEEVFRGLSEIDRSITFELLTRNLSTFEKILELDDELTKEGHPNKIQISSLERSNPDYGSTIYLRLGKPLILNGEENKWLQFMGVRVWPTVTGKVEGWGSEPKKPAGGRYYVEALKRVKMARQMRRNKLKSNQIAFYGKSPFVYVSRAYLSTNGRVYYRRKLGFVVQALRQPDMRLEYDTSGALRIINLTAGNLRDRKTHENNKDVILLRGAKKEKEVIFALGQELARMHKKGLFHGDARIGVPQQPYAPGNVAVHRNPETRKDEPYFVDLETMQRRTDEMSVEIEFELRYQDIQALSLWSTDLIEWFFKGYFNIADVQSPLINGTLQRYLSAQIIADRVAVRSEMRENSLPGQLRRATNDLLDMRFGEQLLYLFLFGTTVLAGACFIFIVLPLAGTKLFLSIYPKVVNAIEKSFPKLKATSLENQKIAEFKEKMAAQARGAGYAGGEAKKLLSVAQKYAKQWTFGTKNDAEVLARIAESRNRWRVRLQKTEYDAIFLSGLAVPMLLFLTLTRAILFTEFFAVCAGWILFNDSLHRAVSTRLENLEKLHGVFSSRSEMRKTVIRPEAGGPRVKEEAASPATLVSLALLRPVPPVSVLGNQNLYLRNTSGKERHSFSDKTVSLLRKSGSDFSFSILMKAAQRISKYLEGIRTRIIPGISVVIIFSAKSLSWVMRIVEVATAKARTFPFASVLGESSTLWFNFLRTEISPWWTFSSSRKFIVFQKNGVKFTLAEHKGGVVKGGLDMFGAQGGISLANFFKIGALFQHLKDKINHDASVLKTWLAMANVGADRNVFFDEVVHDLDYSMAGWARQTTAALEMHTNPDRGLETIDQRLAATSSRPPLAFGLGKRSEMRFQDADTDFISEKLRAAGVTEKIQRKVRAIQKLQADRSLKTARELEAALERSLIIGGAKAKAFAAFFEWDSELEDILIYGSKLKISREIMLAVEPARERDAADIFEISKAIFTAEGAGYPAVASVLDIIKDDHDDLTDTENHFFVYRENGKVRGYVNFSVHKDIGAADVLQVAVRGPENRAIIAMALAMQALKQIQSKFHIEKVVSLPLSKNAGRMLKRLGFAPVTDAWLPAPFDKEKYFSLNMSNSEFIIFMLKRRMGEHIRELILSFGLPGVPRRPMVTEEVRRAYFKLPMKWLKIQRIKPILPTTELGKILEARNYGGMRNMMLARAAGIEFNKDAMIHFLAWALLSDIKWQGPSGKVYETKYDVLEEMYAAVLSYATDGINLRKAILDAAAENNLYPFYKYWYIRSDIFNGAEWGESLFESTNATGDAVITDGERRIKISLASHEAFARGEPVQLETLPRSEMRTKEMSPEAGDPKGTVPEPQASGTVPFGADHHEALTPKNESRAGSSGARSESRAPLVRVPRAAGADSSLARSQTRKDSLGREIKPPRKANDQNHLLLLSLKPEVVRSLTERQRKVLEARLQDPRLTNEEIARRLRPNVNREAVAKAIMIINRKGGVARRRTDEANSSHAKLARVSPDPKFESVIFQEIYWALTPEERELVDYVRSGKNHATAKAEEKFGLTGQGLSFRFNQIILKRFAARVTGWKALLKSWTQLRAGEQALKRVWMKLSEIERWALERCYGILVPREPFGAIYRALYRQRVLSRPNKYEYTHFQTIIRKKLLRLLSALPPASSVESETVLPARSLAEQRQVGNELLAKVNSLLAERELTTEARKSGLFLWTVAAAGAISAIDALGRSQLFKRQQKQVEKLEEKRKKLLLLSQGVTAEMNATKRAKRTGKSPARKAAAERSRDKTNPEENAPGDAELTRLLDQKRSIVTWTGHEGDRWIAEAQQLIAEINTPGNAKYSWRKNPQFNALNKELEELIHRSQINRAKFEAEQQALALAQASGKQNRSEMREEGLSPAAASHWGQSKSSVPNDAKAAIPASLVPLASGPGSSSVPGVARAATSPVSQGAKRNSSPVVVRPAQRIGAALISRAELGTMSEENYLAFYKTAYAKTELRVLIYGKGSSNSAEEARIQELRKMINGKARVNVITKDESGAIAHISDKQRAVVFTHAGKMNALRKNIAYAALDDAPEIIGLGILWAVTDIKLGQKNGFLADFSGQFLASIREQLADRVFARAA